MANAMALAVVLDQHGFAEALLQAGGQREVAGAEHRAPGHDPVAGVHIALAGKPDGLDVVGPVVLGEGRDCPGEHVQQRRPPPRLRSGRSTWRLARLRPALSTRRSSMRL